MKSLPATLIGLVLVLAGATGAIASELISLKDGVTGAANVIDTTVDSITVSLSKDDTTVTVTLKAAQMDPYSFYEIRRDYMEESAESHLRLALFCVDHGMFSRARYHADRARALDPAYVEKVRAIPDLLHSVADKVLESARKAYDENDLATAERLAAAILTRFPDSPAATQADALLAHIADKEQARQAKRRVEVLVAARKAAGQDQTTKAAEHDAILAPILDRLELARKLRSQGLRERDNARALSALEAAAVEYGRSLGMIEKSAAEHAEDPALVSVLALGDGQVRAEAISCLVAVGSLRIAAGSFAEAEKVAGRALALDPESEAALGFRATVSLATAWAGGGRR
jgi:hypothetical protein